MNIAGKQHHELSSDEITHDRHQPGTASTLTPPLLVSAVETARLLSIGESTLWRLLSGKEVPEPIRLAGRTLWRREDVELFVSLNCEMSRFAATKAAKEKSRR